MRTDGIWFKDEFGRTLLLRGANLGGRPDSPSISPVQFASAPYSCPQSSRGYGRIVNVSIDWGPFAAGLGGPGLYAVTKAP